MVQTHLARPPWKVVAALAIAFMFLVPTVLLTTVPVARHTISPHTAWAAPAAAGLFALGWLMTGAALKPLGSLRRRIVAAVAVYLLTGLLVIIGVNVAMGASPQTIVNNAGNILIGTLFWPLAIAQAMGLFGLRLGA